MAAPSFERSESSSTGPGLFVLGLAIGLLFAWIVDRATRLFLDSELELVRNVRDLALDEFVSDVDSAELTDGALRGMLAGLDRYSRYYDAEETSSVKIAPVAVLIFGLLVAIGTVLMRVFWEF